MWHWGLSEKRIKFDPELERIYLFLAIYCSNSKKFDFIAHHLKKSNGLQYCSHHGLMSFMHYKCLRSSDSIKITYTINMTILTDGEHQEKRQPAQHEAADHNAQGLGGFLLA